MDCPRCDRTLSRYTFRGREAVACDACGFVGVPVEHRGTVAAVESWDDAVSRVGGAGRADAVTVETADEAALTEILASDGGGSTWYACDVCGKAFDERAKLDGHTAVHAREDQP